MKNSKLLIGLLVLIVVGYIIYKRREEDGSEIIVAEETSGAFGRVRGRGNVAKAGEDTPCVCQGYFIGNMSEGKCRRQCKKANNYNF